MLDCAVEKSEPGCSAAVGIAGEVVWLGAPGVADLASGDEITADMAFDLSDTVRGCPTHAPATG